MITNLSKLETNAGSAKTLASGNTPMGTPFPTALGTHGGSISQPKWGVLGDSSNWLRNTVTCTTTLQHRMSENLSCRVARASVTDFDAAVALFGTNNAAHRSPEPLKRGPIVARSGGVRQQRRGFNGKPFGMRTYQGDDVANGIVTAFLANEAPIPKGGIRWILGYSAGYPFQNFWHLRSRVHTCDACRTLPAHQ